MTQKKKLLLLALTFVLILGGAAILYRTWGDDLPQDQITQSDGQGGGNGTGEEQEIPIFDFMAYDTEGNEIRLSDYFGKPIVLNFWASWCGPCKMEMPDFQKKYEALGEDVQFLMVNATTSYRETEAQAKEYIQTSGYTFPVLYDRTGEALATYGVNAFPTTYFLNAQGQAVAYAISALDEATLQKGIDMIQ